MYLVVSACIYSNITTYRLSATMIGHLKSSGIFCQNSSSRLTADISIDARVTCLFSNMSYFYNALNVYRRELAPGTVSLTGDRAQGDDSKHWAYSRAATIQL